MNGMCFLWKHLLNLLLLLLLHCSSIHDDASVRVHMYMRHFLEVKLEKNSRRNSLICENVIEHRIFECTRPMNGNDSMEERKCVFVLLLLIVYTKLSVEIPNIFQIDMRWKYTVFSFSPASLNLWQTKHIVNLSHKTATTNSVQIVERAHITNQKKSRIFHLLFSLALFSCHQWHKRDIVKLNIVAHSQIGEKRHSPKYSSSCSSILFS